MDERAAETIFKAENVKKKYRRLQLSSGQWKTNYALDGINMEIRRGDIYGLVGGNGAGKTTLMRILAGLAAPTEGTIELFGESDPKKLHIQRRRINGIIETPALNPALTAWENLEVCRLQQGLADDGRVEEALSLAGLAPRDIEGVKVRNFSLGMKQRLGIAKALLGRPELLFFDEPLNGLDPEGVWDFGALIGRLKESGVTVLISSHLLRELSLLATCYGFVCKGKMTGQITARKLEEKGGDLEAYYLSQVQKSSGGMD